MTELKIEVFTSPTCPHCPGAVEATKRLLSENPELDGKVKWEELSTRTPEGSRKAAAYGVRGVPTIVTTNSKGEKGAFVGAPTQKAYLNMIKEMMK
jgi:thioredoxin 1